MDRVFDERDLVHVMRMVLIENKGNVLTDALCFGIEGSVLAYLKVLPEPVGADKTESGNET